jgi:hypothetical protein
MKIKVQILGFTIVSLSIERGEDGTLENLGEIADNMAEFARSPIGGWWHRRHRD